MSIASLNPFKKDVYLMSPLKGKLLKGGEPLANIELEVMIVMPGGKKRFYQHSTDDNGNFDLPGITETMHIGPMTEFAVGQFVYALIDGKKDEIWAVAKREPGLFAERRPPAETIGLTCDIEHPERAVEGDIREMIITKCEWTDLKEI